MEGGGRGPEEEGIGAFHRCRVSAWENEKLLKMDSADGCIAMGTYFMPPNLHLRVEKLVPLCYLYLSTIKTTGSYTFEVLGVLPGILDGIRPVEGHRANGAEDREGRPAPSVTPGAPHCRAPQWGCKDMGLSRRRTSETVSNEGAVLWSSRARPPPRRARVTILGVTAHPVCVGRMHLCPFCTTTPVGGA